MKKTLLSSAVAACLLAGLTPLATSAGAVMPTRGATKAADDAVAWYTSSALADPATRAEVLAKARRGVGIVVTAEPGQRRYEMETFGFQAAGRTSVYRAGRHGRLDVVTIDDTGASAAEKTGLWAMLAKPARPEEEDEATVRGAARLASTPEEPSGEAPRLAVSMRSGSAGGRSTYQEITVLRDVSAGRDSKVVIVKTTHDIIPGANGLTDGKGAPVSGSRALYVTIPNAYEVTTVLGTPRGSAPVVLEDRLPASSDLTKHDFQQSKETTTTFGVGASAAVTASLSQNGVRARGKLAVSLDYRKTTVERTSLQMAFDDYSIQAQTRTYPLGSAAMWRFPLATLIAQNPAYFGSGWFRTDRFVTPFMRHATVETIAVWRLPGDYEEEIQIGSNASIENRWYGFTEPSGSSILADPANATRRLSAVGLLPSCDTGACDDPGRQPWVVSRIDLSSPFLTASPTVLIQSKSGADLCLSHTTISGPDVALFACSLNPEDKWQQWTFDSEGRYRNRRSGFCLQTNDTGWVGAGRCTLDRGQRWAWQADRIHSLLGGVGGRRLLAQGRTVNAKHDPAVQQAFPVNTYNPLLDPWSSYPSAPLASDYVPNFYGTLPPVDAKYRGFRAASDTERWDVIPLRPGL